jgi:PleD family two-component response regulator
MLNNKELKVLIIDDDINSILVLKNILKEENYTVLSSSSYQGFGVAIKERPDIIIMELLLKNRNGFEILRNLKNSTWTQDIPVFILSKLNTDLYREEAYQLGIAGYMVKPDHYSSLLRRIRANRALRRHYCSQKSLTA